MNPQIPLFNAGTLAGEFSETLTSPRFRAILLAGFAMIALLLSSLVYGVGTTDPLTFLLMGAALLGVAAAACWIPARRATRVDPVVALRRQ